MNQSFKYFIYSSVLTVAGICAIGVSVSSPKPWRLIGLGTMGLAAVTAAKIAHDGIRPAELEQLDRAAQLACEEAEHENALQDIQETDDLEREMKFYQQRLLIEADAMQRTLPVRLELERMRSLFQPQVLIQSPPSQQNQPTEIQQQSKYQYFNWGELSNADEHPLLMICAKQGAGKTRLIRFLAAHILSGASVVAVDIFARRGDWEGCKVYDDYGSILQWMKSAIATVDHRVTEYKEGKTDFTPQLWAFEEFPDTSKSIIAQDKSAAKVVTQFMDKASTVARKTRCRLCLISQKLTASGSGADAEVRDDATVIFPGRSGIGKATADSRILKLGTRRNDALRERLLEALAGVERPALVYSSGQWYPAIIPELDENGNPVVDLEQLYKRS